MKRLATLLLLFWAGAAAAGTLEIETLPGVDVFWEGIHLATTDADGMLVVEAVPEGPFSLTLRKEGFAELATEVHIGEGTTRLARVLKPLAAEPAPTQEATPPPPAAEETLAVEPPPAAPGVRVSRGAWLFALVVVVAAAGFALRARLKGSAPTPARERGRRPKPRVTRAPAAADTGGGFLSELRQRERALDELVDVSAEAARADVPEPDVVDVAWKEID